MTFASFCLLVIIMYLLSMDSFFKRLAKRGIIHMCENEKILKNIANSISALSANLEEAT